MILSCWILLRLRSVSDKSCRENQSMHFMFDILFFFKNRSFYGKIWYRQTGHRWQYNTVHALCMLDNLCYEHTLRICNNYSFPTATTITRMHLSVTLYIHRLSYFNYERLLASFPKPMFQDHSMLPVWVSLSNLLRVTIMYGPCLFSW